MAIIVADFENTKSKNVIINRMIQLHLIADRSEILPAKKKRSKETNNTEEPNNGDSSTDYEFGNEKSDQENIPVPTSKPKKLKKKKPTTVPKKNEVKKKISKPKMIPLDVQNVKMLISNFDDTMKEVLAWIEESLNDAVEDMEEPSNDPDDSVPLVPFTAVQREAFARDDFKTFLLAMGFQAPSEMVCFYFHFIKIYIFF